MLANALQYDYICLIFFRIEQKLKYNFKCSYCASLTLVSKCTYFEIKVTSNMHVCQIIKIYISMSNKFFFLYFQTCFDIICTCAVDVSSWPLSTVWYVVVLHFTISRRWKYTLFFDIWNKNPHFIGISIELTYSQCSFEEMFMFFSSNDDHIINIIKQYLIPLSFMH